MRYARLVFMYLCFFAGFGLPAWGQTPFNTLHLTPETRRYQVYVGTTPMARAVWLLQRATPATGDTFVFKWKMEGYLNQETEIYFLKKPELPGMRSRFVSEKQNAVAVYDQDSVRIQIVTRTRAKGVKEKKTVQLYVPPGAIDLALLRLAITRLPLDVGRSVQMQVVDLREGKLINARGFVSRLTRVTVPAGTFECYRLELFVGLAREIDFIEAQPPYRLIRQIYPAVDIDIRLVQD